MSEIILSAIYIYPIKSLGGIPLSTWPIIQTGFKFDRKWMLIDADGHFLSQRRLPKMALIHTALTDQHLVVSADGMPDLLVELEPRLATKQRCTIWDEQVEAHWVSAEADKWFSSVLSTDCRLVYLPGTSIRRVNPTYANPDDQTAFSDGFPFLLLSDESLSALNTAMGLAFTMNRFRPNLVVKGAGSYAEDIWRLITIGTITFRLPKPCSRCTVPTINPMTGETGKEPLVTLNRLRKWENKVYFGQNALHNNTGVLSVGDKIGILEIGESQPPLLAESQG